MSSAPLLKLVDVSKSYSVGDQRVPVLDGISFTCEAGESIAVIGPSGCGKSTLLNIIGTLDQPERGEVFLENEKLSGLDENKIAEVRQRKIGFIFQQHHLLPQCTVLENVLVPVLAVKNISRPDAEKRAVRLLERVGLSPRLHHRPGELSGGERQRVAVVRALINQPKLLLADEPTGALDRHSAEKLGELLVELNREQNVALILVTHALDLAAKMKRQFELKEGKLELKRM